MQMGLTVGTKIKIWWNYFAAAPRQYPDELLDLLVVEGKLVIPVGLEGQQKLYVITKKSETENEEIIHEEVAFVPMLPGVSNGEI